MCGAFPNADGRQMTALFELSLRRKNVRNRYRFAEKFAGEFLAFEKIRLGVPFVVLVK